MDEIDKKQQEEIDALKLKDVQHDAQLSPWGKISMIMFAVVLALFIGGVILSPLLLSRPNPTADVAEFWCPHEDCPHHKKRFDPIRP